MEIRNSVLKPVRRGKVTLDPRWMSHLYFCLSYSQMLKERVKPVLFFQRFSAEMAFPEEGKTIRFRRYEDLLPCHSNYTNSTGGSGSDTGIDLPVSKG